MKIRFRNEFNPSFKLLILNFEYEFTICKFSFNGTNYGKLLTSDNVEVSVLSLVIRVVTVLSCE